MRAGYITSYDSTDVQQWSGTGFYIAQALEAQGIDLFRVGPLEKYVDIGMIGRLLINKTRRLKYQRKREPKMLRRYAEEISRRIKGEKLDFLFSPGTMEMAYLKTDIPIVLWSDCTFDGMVNFYPNMTGLAPETLRDGHAAEQAALTGCRLALYSSQWAAQSALDFYDVDPAKIKVVPFGANVTAAPKRENVAKLIAARGRDPVRLLFVGVEWERKGGDYAVALVDQLVGRGIPVELTIVGCNPPASDRRPQVINRGFLSKNVPEQREQLEKLFREAHFLVIPSRAECYGIVVAEANMFGVPVLASDVGAFPEIAVAGRNGFNFPLSRFAEESARRIAQLREEPGAYEKLAASAFAESVDRLNWDTAGRQVKALIETAIAKS